MNIKQSYLLDSVNLILIAHFDNSHASVIFPKSVWYTSYTLCYNKHSDFWFCLSMLIIFLISALYYTYNMFEII